MSVVKTQTSPFLSIVCDYEHSVQRARELQVSIEERLRVRDWPIFLSPNCSRWRKNLCGLQF